MTEPIVMKFSKTAKNPNIFEEKNPKIILGFEELPYYTVYHNNWRSLGVADMAESLNEDYPHRASGKLAYHVLDVMLPLEESAEQKKELEVKSTCKRPLAMPASKLTGSSLTTKV